MSDGDIDLSDFEGEANIYVSATSTRSCKVANIKADLDDDHQLRLQAALDKESISSERIVVALRGWGYSVGETMVRRHRKRLCTCAS